MNENKMINLKKRIAENDNRCTASPYLLLLQVKRTYIGDEEYGHHQGSVKYVEHYTGDYMTADSEVELKNEIKLLYDEGEDIDFDKYNITRFWEGYYWETVNVFLTDKGYKEHIKLNGHNIGEHRTYGIHAFRNPEFDEVIKMINKEEKNDN